MAEAQGAEGGVKTEEKKEEVKRACKSCTCDLASSCLVCKSGICNCTSVDWKCKCGCKDGKCTCGSGPNICKCQCPNGECTCQIKTCKCCGSRINSPNKCSVN